MNAVRMAALVVVAVLFLAVCGGENDGSENAGLPARADSVRGDTTGVAGTLGIEATQGDLVDEMEASMQMMTSMSADSMETMLPMHRRLLSDMIARINQDMTAASLAGDAAWTATVDSLQDDLTRMPNFGDDELRAFMPAHQDRVMRLIRMHRSMTAQIGR